MSNDSGFFVGAVLRCEFEKEKATVVKSGCPEHGNYGSSFCPRCGKKSVTQKIEVERFPFPYSVYDGDRLSFKPCEPENKKGVLFFASNVGDYGVDDGEESAEITHELIDMWLETFYNDHSDDIEKISSHPLCKKAEVRFMFIPWGEY